MLRQTLLAGLALCASPAFANDSVAELGTGGLILSRTGTVSMDSEDLFISPDKVTVDYVFRNNAGADQNLIVAFPMPDIYGDPESMVAIPGDAGDNFLDFEVTVDGKPVKPQLEQKAYAVGIDVTEELKSHNVPLYPFGEEASAAVAKLPLDVQQDWAQRGILIDYSGDDQPDFQPYWQLRSTYWWRQVFPASKELHVSHRYKPSVGGISSVSFFYDGKFQGNYDSYKTRYCLDKGFENTVLKAAKDNPDGYPRYSESFIQYVLTTGGNWAQGTIGKFKLTIDKGDPKNVISFCGENVKKTGPTTFEMTADDFYPERDLDILFLNPVEPAAEDGDN